MKKHLRTLARLARLAPLAALLCTLPAHALYKVVGPDGKVTYTDRPELASGSKVTSLSAAGTAQSDVALPLELRQAVSRYPVTLYTTSNCGPCDTGRLLLRQRGIPYAEKLINTNEDADALLRLSGSRDAPTLMIGAQALRGLSADAWHSYLDSAGYPRESRLPANYQFATATPLVERREATPEVRPPAAPPEPAPPAPSPTGIKF